MGPVRQNPIQRTVRTAHLSVLMTVCNFSTQYSTEQFWQSPLLPPDKHHSSDAVYWRGEGMSHLKHSGTTVPACDAAMLVELYNVCERQRESGDCSMYTDWVADKSDAFTSFKTDNSYNQLLTNATWLNHTKNVFKGCSVHGGVCGHGRRRWRQVQTTEVH